MVRLRALLAGQLFEVRTAVAKLRELHSCFFLSATASRALSIFTPTAYLIADAAPPLLDPLARGS
jgi:hypothetical protein